ncbi:spore protease YyaC [Alkalibaculum sp. M08DMB]|uniref:Spore protease YyaC n=1 Tax=Alkalibaculum sporogenes TaxID=2655001 RepID=A0A6A7K8J7_9FIRM|nr:spore protease YyaC [Alkalibaculum sporogenes]MPW25423.1 spore protease YyaC [Alkalibaculum sporogenes]
MLGIKRNNSDSIVYDVKEPNASVSLSLVLRDYLSSPFVIVCIGTDRCIGDSLGPLVGYNLKNLNVKYPVYGTIFEPIHAVNLKDNLKYLNAKYPNHNIIAIDASLGNSKSVGTIQFREGPLYPGKGVGKKLPPVGNFSLIGIVDSVDKFNSSSIHQVRLSLIIEMAEVITQSIYLATHKAVPI